MYKNNNNLLDLMVNLPACQLGHVVCDNLSKIDKIAVVGMSCAGKTSMINAVRTHSLTHSRIT